ncbi:MAG TPA: hypothetical protein VFS64_09365 [Solirubrobacterales bacterium]|nr:hypothetical protein [Solirubrobacterales bacterium]
MRRLPSICAIVLPTVAAAIAAGCGEGEAANGAVVSVYVAAPLCREAQAELARAGGDAGDLKVRAICLADTQVRSGADLASAGANARRATEDSASVAFLEAPGPAARFTGSIVDAAKIAWIETSSGSAVMQRVLEALEGRGSSSPRSAVLDQLG